MTVDENVPLLRPVDPHEAIYARFTRSQKTRIVALVSFAGLLPLFVSGSFLPSIPQIVKDLDSTAQVISLAVSLSVLTNATGCLLWASYSSFYGRKPIYIASLICQCLGSLGVASSRSVPELLVFRVVQALGASSGWSIGVAVIGDIYKVEERGTASGIFFGAVCLGPALAPLVGGFAAEYYSWRIMQLGLLACGILMLAIVLTYLPETMHPGARGVDKLEDKDKTKLVLLNPFRSLNVLRSPNILLVCLGGGLALMTNFALLVPIAYTMGKRYHIDNAAILGSLFIPSGVGNILGASFAGRLSDIALIRGRASRGGILLPEDRLKVARLGACLMVPMSMLGAGLFTTFVDGNLGIALNLCCLFINGLGVDFVLSPAAAYNIDILHSRSAEVAAATMAMRGLMIASCTSIILPLINTQGLLISYIIMALCCWIGSIGLCVVVRHGDRLRAWNDIGFSTAQVY
ncbi:MFS general substrate transporter [Cristinia sonorae]|uniref:MFS general substrate transporter n=1 Tax=Cristinia sonorae TaxID=1940300 RepID=A0A8K0ULE0_9AGAR|nr:MFS general substrate transporter [Cristinia sonorae]